MVNPLTRNGATPVARFKSALAFAILIGLSVASVHAQTAPVSESAPSWADPVDDVTGQVASPVANATVTHAFPAQIMAPTSPIAVQPPVAHVAQTAPLRPTQTNGMASIGGACSTNGLLAQGIGGSGLLHCSGGVWSVNAVTTEQATPVAAVPNWNSGTSTSLRGVTQEWAKQAGWRVVWHATDRQLDAAVGFSGSFSDAIHGLFGLYAQKKQPLYVDSYPNQMPPLVVITEAL